MSNHILPELENKDYIGDLQSKYDIMFCPVEAVEELVEFIDKYWRKNHIFVISRELLNWQHLDESNNRYNFVIARDKQTKEIHSILGFVPTFQFDCDIEAIQIWPCIWKVRKNLKIKGLGVSLYHFLVNQMNVETISILGISETALSIYKKWNFSTGKISHYFMLNNSIEDYQLVKNYSQFEKGSTAISDDNCSIEVCPLDRFLALNENIFTDISKYKSKNYYIKRFYKHPIYKYIPYAIIKNHEVKAVFFVRECVANNRKALRIVEFIGSISSVVGNVKNFQAIMNNLSAEYIDFIHVGLNDLMLNESGFTNKCKTELIIGNYFEPFILENIELDYAFKSIASNSEPIFYKADADQDRPNII